MISKIRTFLKLEVLSRFTYIFHRLLSFTWRVETLYSQEIEENLQNGTTMIFAHWHQDETVLVLSIRKLRGGILNSMSSDGQMMARIVRLYGAKTAKGSSSRGGVEALKGLIRLSKSGRNPTIAVDGPRGPFRQIKPGVFQLSRLSKAKIYTASVHYSSAWHFPRAWDKAYLPKPFAKVLINWEYSMPAVQKKEDPKSEDLAFRLGKVFAQTEANGLRRFTEFSSQC